MKPGQLKREQQLLIGLVLLVGVGLWAYDAYALKPLLATLSQLRQEIHHADIQLKHISQAVAEEPWLRQQYDELTEHLKSLRTSLPSEEQLPAMIERLSDLASQTGVKIQTIFPQRSFETLGVAPGLEQSVVKPPDLYRGIPIQIDALTGFHQLGTFLARVEAGNQPMQLRSLRISGNPKEFRRHNVKLVLVLYFEAPEPKATATSASTRSHQEGS